MTYCFGYISASSRWILLIFCLASIFFDILIANNSWTVAQTPINHIIFWISIMRTFRCIYLNCFNRLRFLAEVIPKLQKMHFFRQFKHHNSGREHGNLTNDPIFSSNFFDLTVCNIYFWIWKYSKFILKLSPLWSILVCKILQFLAKSYQFGQPIILF